MAHAMGYALPLYELRFGASRNSHSRVAHPVDAGCATQKWGDCGIGRKSSRSTRSEHLQTPFQPGGATENSPWREPWDHRQVDRAPARGERPRCRRLPPPAGAFHARPSPMAHAMGLEFLHSLQPEGRKIIAHGASRGNSVLGNRAPERGERLVSTPQVAHIVCHAVLP